MPQLAVSIEQTQRSPLLHRLGHIVFLEVAAVDYRALSAVRRLLSRLIFALHEGRFGRAVAAELVGQVLGSASNHMGSGLPFGHFRDLSRVVWV